MLVVHMAIMTERERQIIRMLRDRVSVGEIGKNYNVSETSISRSISNVKRKILDIEEDISFLIEMGFFSIKNNKIECISESRDPKALSQ